MSEKSESSQPFRREELRGLFTLGLLAVVASIRLQHDKIILTYQDVSCDVTGFFDIMLVTWSLYAFFMVFGLSEDIVGKKISDYFLRISNIYLLFSFVILGILGADYFNLFFPERAIWIFGFIAITIAYLLVKLLYLKVKKISNTTLPKQSDIKEVLKNLKPKIIKNIPDFFAGLFMNAIILILFGLIEDLVVPIFVFGSICLIIFLVGRDLIKNNEK